MHSPASALPRLGICLFCLVCMLLSPAGLLLLGAQSANAHEHTVNSNVQGHSCLQGRGQQISGFVGAAA